MGMVLFDDLLQGVQAALMNAQRALLRRGEEVVRANGAGDVLHVTMPRADGGPGEEVIDLPASGFRVRRNLRVASLSMSFECELRHTFLLALAGTCSVVIPEAEVSGGAARRNMRIVFEGQERPAGEVWLDGQRLVSVAPVVCAPASEAPDAVGAMVETSVPGAAMPETQVDEATVVENAGTETEEAAESGRSARGKARPHRWSIIRWVAAWLLRHVGAPGFVLTPQQADRARRILERPVGATANGPPAQPCQQGG